MVPVALLALFGVTASCSSNATTTDVAPACAAPVPTDVGAVPMGTCDAKVADRRGDILETIAFGEQKVRCQWADDFTGLVCVFNTGYLSTSAGFSAAFMLQVEFEPGVELANLQFPIPSNGVQAALFSEGFSKDGAVTDFRGPQVTCGQVSWQYDSEAATTSIRVEAILPEAPMSPDPSAVVLTTVCSQLMTQGVARPLVSRCLPSRIGIESHTSMAASPGGSEVGRGDPFTVRRAG